MNVVEILTAAKELIAEPTRWTQRAFARNKYGKEVFENDKSAVCWCLDGALMHAVDHGLDANYWDAYYILQGPINFNDTHTHAEVMEYLNAAIKRAERQEG